MQLHNSVLLRPLEGDWEWGTAPPPQNREIAVNHNSGFFLIPNS